MSGELMPFIRYHIAESLRRQSEQELLDANFNILCFKIHAEPINIAPPVFWKEGFIPYRNPKVLYIYPSKADSYVQPDKPDGKDYLDRTSQFLEAVHGIEREAIFEIRGSKKAGIICCFYAEDIDIALIDSAVRNYFPKTITDPGDPEPVITNEDLSCYDFIPDAAPFYTSLTSYKTFISSPINLIAQILLNLDGDSIGVYQVLIIPLPGKCHELVKEASDMAWKSSLPVDNPIPPSLQAGEAAKRLGYKNPEFRGYYAACARIILPTDSLESSVRAFISSFTYGSKSFVINSDFSQGQIREMLNNKISYHTGFLVNSHELAGMLHVPYQILFDKTFTDFFAFAPAGDKPQKTAEYKDIAIGIWNKRKEIHLPVQKEIPHAHIMGVSRSGKSILLGHIAIEKFKKRETVFVLDPHGDLVENIMKMVPEELIDDVVVIDFGLKDATPQITIRGNVDITNPSKVSDDLSESMRDVTSVVEKYWGPKLSYCFSCLYFTYSVLPDLTLVDVRHLVSPTQKGKSLRKKVAARIEHPIIRDFLEEINSTSYESMIPVITRLSHLLLDEKSLRLFTLEQNKISIGDIMESGKLCLVGLAQGIIGRQRSSIMSGLVDSLINNNMLARAAIPYNQRKPCTLIKDEFYLMPGDLDIQFSGMSKYGLSVIVAHQYFHQLEGKTREVLGTAGTRIAFKLRREDADLLAKDFGIDASEFTGLRKHEAFVKIEDEVVKINAPRPAFRKEDFSRQIMQNNLDKYYLHHDKKPAEKKKKLMFDML